MNLEANFFLWSAPLEWSRMYCFPELQPFPQSPSLASAELMGAGLGCEDPSLHPQDRAGSIPMAAILLSLCPGLHLTLAGWQEEQRCLQARKAVLLSAEQQAICNFWRAFKELDTPCWCLI